MKTYKCDVCGYVYEDEEDVIKHCLKCGADKSHLILLTEDEKAKVYGADRTNDIHMEIIELSMKIDKLADEGLEIKLDQPCIEVFKKAKTRVWEMKQLSKAEIASHIQKGKY